MGHLSHGPANRRRRVLQTAAPLFVREPWTNGFRGGAIVLHDVLGVTERAEDACRRLARDDWMAVSPYLYYEHGGPAFDAEELAAARAEMERLQADDLEADLNGALSYLRGRGCSQVAVVGFGMGGYLAAWAAANLGVAGAVAVAAVGAGEAPWVGLPPLESLLADIRTPLLNLQDVQEDGQAVCDDTHTLRGFSTERGSPSLASTWGLTMDVAVRPRAGGDCFSAVEEIWARIAVFLSNLEGVPQSLKP